ncbi:hypothetical protein SAMN02745248_00250 [Hathewaya proteolytica DSM 3090]|uniref:Uncharacterized protein n=2 Tax=Hathewaya proteolytica TaxID=29365 RepID=A0A1M6JMS1_9CLOT|nr:hypothetical protein SAMN02745248_00250 [Hathewaya proteolytica DSM 3090]
MLILIGVLLATVGVIIVWFNIPYSKVKKEFQKDVNALMSNNHLKVSNHIFVEKDFAHLPSAIQKYIKSCNYIGTPKMSYLKMEYNDVDFMQKKSGSSLLIDYIQYNFVLEPCRMALIDSSVFGIPFEGYDYYENGIGGMKGVMAKAFTLFNQRGKDMNKACLVTFLAESLFVPTVLLQDYVSFDELNDFEVKATITYGGETASGIFKFNEKYEMISFKTKDRAVVRKDGTMEYVPWSANCTEYQVYENGIKYPTKFQAVWNYTEGDFVYFDGSIKEISYGF